MNAPATAPRFAGYAAIFGQRDSGGDVILPGAFANTLAHRSSPLPLYWQHRADRLIGWIDHAAEDARGLRVVGTLAPARGPAAQALSLRRVNGLSFGYRVAAATRDAEGRTLAAVDLVEISLVTRPMQPLARIHLIA